jgi:hypothetical protein
MPLKKTFYHEKVLEKLHVRVYINLFVYWTNKY